MNLKNPVSNILNLTGHAGAVYSLDFDGEYIYSASADKFVVRWNIKLGTQDSFAIKFPFSPYSIKLFNQNNLIAVGLASGDLYFFDLIKRKEVKFYQQHKTGIFTISENEITNHLYVGDADGNISVWDTLSLKLVIYLPLDCGKIRKMKPSQDGTKLFILSQDGNVRIFDAESFNELHQFHAHQDGATSFVELSPTIIATGGKDAHLNLWDLVSHHQTKSIPAHNFVIYDLLLLNENILVSASRDKSIKLWNIHEMNVVQRIERKDNGHKHSVNQLVKISDDSFASCSDDSTIKIWKFI